MSLFKERQQSAKKTVELQNKVLSLQIELEKALTKSKKDQKCTKCAALGKELSAAQKEAGDFATQVKQLNKELKELRVEPKKSSSKSTTAGRNKDV
jgi:predicted  nucleic acid-binding Zn-ribbon protein